MSTLGGTQLGGTGGTSLGGKPGGTALGGTALGGTALGGTSLGGAVPKPATALGGTALGGTALGGAAPKPTGTALGGTALGGTALGGTSLGGAAPKPATSIGGTALGANTGTEQQPAAKKKKPKKKPAAQNQGNDSQVEGNEAGKDESIPLEKTDEKPKQPAAQKKGAAAKAPAKDDKKVKGPPKGVAAMIRAKQLEAERLKKDEIEKQKREEEEEKIRIQDEKAAEEERKKRAKEKKEAQLVAKKKKEQEDLESKRLKAMEKYGLDKNLVPGIQGRGNAKRGGRGKGKGRGGRGSNEGTQGNGEAENDHENGETNEAKEETPSETKEETQTKVEAVPDSWDAEDILDSWEAKADIPDDWENESVEETPPTEAKLDSPPNDKETTSDSEPKPQADEEEKKKEKGTEPESLRKAKKEEQRKKEEEQKRKKEEEQKRKDENLAKQASKTNLRSPICCVLGHVDTGKTLLLDKIRNTNVQAGEAGGITQQIGATFFPMNTIMDITKSLQESLKNKLSYKVPGLLVIDTPGHASFTNLRSRGSSLCDIAILVIDIMHGVEPQTRESIQLLKMRKTPFIVAMNKIDRCYGWSSTEGMPFKFSYEKQDVGTTVEFEDRTKKVISDLAAEGLNAELYYRNKDFRSTISLVPTSAITGEGIPDLLMLIIQLSQKLMADKLLELSSLDCTVLEVKKLSGRGTTLDVILANGILKQGDKIVICGLNGEAIVTTIRAILTPAPMTELRIKGGEYLNNKQVKAAIGCKIDAPGLEEAVAGSPLFVVNPGEDVDDYKKKVMGTLNYLEGKINKNGEGVYVQTSTLGSMEALLEFLSKDCKIPVSGIRIGPVHKRDVMRASIMLEKKHEYAVILAFDVKVMDEAREFADKVGVKIFEADIIYHLFDFFTNYLKEVDEKKKDAAKDTAVFPCILQILPEHIYRNRDPIVCGVKIEEGYLKKGTPIVVRPAVKDEKEKTETSNQWLTVGIVTNIEKDKIEMGPEGAKPGDEVCIEIKPKDGAQKLMLGRQFDEDDKLYSHITRQSLNSLKAHFPEVCSEKETFKLLKKLKKEFDIV